MMAGQWMEDQMLNNGLLAPGPDIFGALASIFFHLGKNGSGRSKL